MIPGVDFPSETMDRMTILQRGNFGLSMQHILDDPSRRTSFLRVNQCFKPDVIVFNNRHWAPGSFTEFQASRFHFLEGAVDLNGLAPRQDKGFPKSDDRKILGGLANKNPMPLIEAIRSLPENYELRLFGGTNTLQSKAADLLSTGRLRLMGKLDPADLPAYYHTLDCVVHTERAGGWANLAAEALACGIPLVCTEHGTLPFARHGDTALVIDEPTGSAIGSAVQLIFRDEELARRLSYNGRRRIAHFAWEDYTQKLLDLTQPDGKTHYFHAPELGLHGKWPIDDRCKDLEPVFKRCAGKTVVDFGAAEGVIPLKCLQSGAASVHGFEREPSRVEAANSLCSDFPKGTFRNADLSSWPQFRQRHKDLLKNTYDLVLYLGLHHHLPKKNRIETMMEAARLAKDIFAIRTSDSLYSEDKIIALLYDEGFCELISDSTSPKEHLGKARIFSRTRTSTPR